MKARVEFKPYNETREVAPATWLRAAKTIEIERYNVRVLVEFNDEERTTLTKFNLWETTIWITPAFLEGALRELASRGLIDTEYPCPLKLLATEFPVANRQFDSSEEALNFQNEVKTAILPRIKELILKHQNPNSSSETLEF